MIDVGGTGEDPVKFDFQVFCLDVTDSMVELPTEIKNSGMEGDWVRNTKNLVKDVLNLKCLGEVQGEISKRLLNTHF